MGTAKWKWFSEMSDRSTSFWFCLVLLLILLVGMRIFAWRVTKELPEEKRLIVKKELIKELQALANIGIMFPTYTFLAQIVRAYCEKDIYTQWRCGSW